MIEGARVLIALSNYMIYNYNLNSVLKHITLVYVKAVTLGALYTSFN